MSGPNLSVVMYRLTIEPERRPKKEVTRRMHLDLAAKVEAQIDKLVKVSLIREVQYPHLVGKYGVSQEK